MMINVLFDAFPLSSDDKKYHKIDKPNEEEVAQTATGTDVITNIEMYTLII